MKMKDERFRVRRLFVLVIDFFKNIWSKYKNFFSLKYIYLFVFIVFVILFWNIFQEISGIKDEISDTQSQISDIQNKNDELDSSISDLSERIGDVEYDYHEDKKGEILTEFHNSRKIDEVNRIAENVQWRVEEANRKAEKAQKKVDELNYKSLHERIRF